MIRGTSILGFKSSIAFVVDVFRLGNFPFELDLRLQSEE